LKHCLSNSGFTAGRRPLHSDQESKRYSCTKCCRLWVKYLDHVRPVLIAFSSTGPSTQTRPNGPHSFQMRLLHKNEQTRRDDAPQTTRREFPASRDSSVAVPCVSGIPQLIRAACQAPCKLLHESGKKGLDHVRRSKSARSGLERFCWRKEGEAKAPSTKEVRQRSYEWSDRCQMLSDLPQGNKG
jgi:hypothetical protein